MENERSHPLSTIRQSLTIVKVVAGLVLLEQACEVLFLGVKLSEQPALAIAALGALAAPVPKKESRS